MTRTTVFFAAILLGGTAIAQTPPSAPPPPVAPEAVAAPAAPAVAAPAAPVAPVAPVAAVAPVAPPAPPPPPLPEDARERVQTVCMNEAKAKAKAAGASDVVMRDVQDTDVKSDGYASMRAKVEIVSIDSKGKTKKKKGTFGCATRNDIVTNFVFD
jgi:hypothetical protein